jgi:hypothetical protein
MTPDEQAAEAQRIQAWVLQDPEARVEAGLAKIEAMHALDNGGVRDVGGALARVEDAVKLGLLKDGAGGG